MRLDAAAIDATKRSLGQNQCLVHNGQNPAIREQILALSEQGSGPSHIARETGLSRHQVRRVLDSEDCGT
jgi:DNA invertase Pin-like site-specific DNA recombinase